MTGAGTGARNEVENGAVSRPTRTGMMYGTLAQVENAAAALDLAGAWLRSDWVPDGAPLSPAQTQARLQARRAIAAAAAALAPADAILRTAIADSWSARDLDPGDDALYGPDPAAAESGSAESEAGRR